MMIKRTSRQSCHFLSPLNPFSPLSQSSTGSRGVPRLGALRKGQRRAGLRQHDAGGVPAYEEEEQADECEDEQAEDKDDLSATSRPIASMVIWLRLAR